ncbi:MAG TPA: primosomal protein N' [Rhabdochlamydiaceae bacterium]|nr:primosomal protein N' [Rhabdochlamydiaceae bacterium]
MSDSEKLAVAGVILESAIDKPLDYAIPAALLSSLRPGMRVEIPVRNTLSQGIVIEIKNSSTFSNLKKIHAILSDGVSQDLLEIALWMESYYGAPLRKVLKTILPPSLREKIEPKIQTFVKPLISLNKMRTLCEELRTKSPQQATVLDVLLKWKKGLLLTQLLEETNGSKSPIQTLTKKGIIECRPLVIDRSPLKDQDYFPTKSKKLSDEQAIALNNIVATLEQKQFKVHLLHGVTGSGKTEIYLQAIECALKLKKGVIFLVPEIALTSQTIERLRGRFEGTIAILHHRLSQGERSDEWRRIQKGEATIVVGARSAIFSPVQNLGLIIIDEEHDNCYKQSDESPRYHARSVAIMRAKFCHATAVLGTATPSIESYYNALTGKFVLSTLKKRPDSADLPTISIVDMKREFERNRGFTLFSEALIHALKGRLKLGEQSLLFLNRRGYHTSSICPQCSHTLKCPHCDISLTYHLGEKILSCHLCDYRISPPRSCPKCHFDGGLKYKGVGTEMVEKALHALFPEVRTLRLDADTTRHKGSHEQIFKQFRAGKADVLIGTQMIAKGLHFPSLTFVGVLAIDGSLNIPDFRSSENTFQLLTQVAGRAGRGGVKGEVIIQTHLPEHETIALAATQDFESFYAKEIEVRKLFDYPPFTHLVKVIFSSNNLPLVQQSAHRFREQLIAKLPATFEIQPLIACGHAKIKDNHRFQFVIKGKNCFPAVKAFKELKESFIDKELKIVLDVDPASTFF